MHPAQRQEVHVGARLAVVEAVGAGNSPPQRSSH